MAAIFKILRFQKKPKTFNIQIPRNIYKNHESFSKDF